MSERRILIFWLFISFFKMTTALTGQPAKVQVIQAGFSANLFYEVDSRDAKIALEIWVKEVFGDNNNAGGTLLRPNVMIFEDLSLLKSAIEKDKLDFLSLSTLDYLELKDQVDFEPILMGSYKGAVGEENVLLVHRDLEGDDLAPLKNGRLIVYPGHRGEISKTWLSTLLLQQGDCVSERYFSEIRLANNPTQAVLQVFFHQADACIVHYYAYQTLAELNPQLKSQLKILRKSPIFAYGLNLLNKRFNPEMKEAIIQVALDVGNFARGQQILKLFGMDKVLRYKPDHIESVETLINNYNILIRSNCPGKKIQSLPNSNMNFNYLNDAVSKKRKTAVGK